MFNIQLQINRITSLALAFLICSINLGMATNTGAYFSDPETAGMDVFHAATLDFVLSTTTDSYIGLTPNNSSGPLPVVISTTTASLPFGYRMMVSNITGDMDLCDLLSLAGSLESIELANSSLTSFAIATTSFPGDGNDWSFVVSLSDAPSSLSSKTCSFDVVYDGWQIGYGIGEAFHDSERTTFTISTGVWEDVVVPGDAINDIAAIIDSSIDESKPDTNSAATNGGNSQVLQLRSQIDNESQAFVGFDFNLPVGSVVTGAELKAYMYQSPTPNTTYSVSRVTDTWTENGVTWTNQPASVFSDDVSTGDANAKWLTWNVTSDVQAIVSGTEDNNGWNMADTDPEPLSGARTGKFRSSEHESASDVRPVLEVTFDAPTATTNHLVINEVFFDVDSGNGSDANNEWIELYNPTPNSISIDNWDICDNTSCDNIPSPVAIPAYGFAVIANASSTFDLHWTDIPAAAIKVALGSSLGNGLAALGDRIILKDASNVTIDQVNYGTDIAVFNPAVLITGEDGKSIARVVKGWDTDSQDDWILNSTPNPGTNPGSDQIEIMRFTGDGVEVAAISVGLEELPELSEGEIAELIADDVPVSEALVENIEMVSEESVEIGVGTTSPETETSTNEVADVQIETETAVLPDPIGDVREEDVILSSPEEVLNLPVASEDENIEAPPVEEDLDLPEEVIPEVSEGEEVEIIQS